LAGVLRAGLGTGVLIGLTTIALQIADQVSGDVLRTSHQTFWSQVGHAWGSSGFGGFGSSALAMLMAIIQVIAGVIVWLELAVRNAAVYLAVLFFPIALAASIWPNLAGWTSRLARLLLLFVILKPVTIVVLAFAGNAALAGLSLNGSLSSSAGTIIAAITIFALAAMAPWTLMLIVGADAESAAVGAGFRAAAGHAASDGAARLGRVGGRVRSHGHRAGRSAGPTGGALLARGGGVARMVPAAPQAADLVARDLAAAEVLVVRRRAGPRAATLLKASLRAPARAVEARSVRSRAPVSADELGRRRRSERSRSPRGSGHQRPPLGHANSDPLRSNRRSPRRVASPELPRPCVGDQQRRGGETLTAMRRLVARPRAPRSRPCRGHRWRRCPPPFLGHVGRGRSLGRPGLRDVWVGSGSDVSFRAASEQRVHPRVASAAARRVDPRGSARARRTPLRRVWGICAGGADRRDRLCADARSPVGAHRRAMAAGRSPLHARSRPAAFPRPPGSRGAARRRAFGRS
jgi:hypothetical protein